MLSRNLADLHAWLPAEHGGTTDADRLGVIKDEPAFGRYRHPAYLGGVPVRRRAEAIR